MAGDSNRPLLIHIGYHKTGTTWFQRRLFQPQFGYNPLMTHEEVDAELVRPHGLTFDPAKTAAAIDARRNKGPAAVDLISSEILSGNPHFGGRESDDYARRLKAVAPNARILITIREQLRAIGSVYMQYIHRAGTLAPKAYLGANPAVGYFGFAPEHFEYHRLAGLYADLFGVENVLVLTQERLAKDPLAIARQLGAFAGVDDGMDLTNLVTAPESPSPPESFAPILRRINHFRSGPMGIDPVLDLGPLSAFTYRATAALGRTSAMKQLLKNARPVTAQVQSRYAGRFAASNRELKALFGARIDLGGYPT